MSDRTAHDAAGAATKGNGTHCRSCGARGVLFWEECSVCDGMGQECSDGMDWCFNCDGSGGEWMCSECLHPEDDDND